MPEMLKWNETGKKFYETGVDRGVLYTDLVGGKFTKAEAWNGLTGVTDSPSGAESNPKYADNVKYINLVGSEDVGGTIKAFTAPASFAVCDGTAEVVDGIFVGQQTRKTFGLSYRTLIGNDVDGQEHGYKIHIIYNCSATPSSKDYATINESPEALELSWEFTTTPAEITETFGGKKLKPAAKVVIDSRKIKPKALAAVEKALYGSSESAAALPTIDELINLIKTNNQDG